jgi:dTDP-4-dehydrorhamnose reductase
MKTMLRLAHDRDALSIVADQRGAPTYAPHIAELVLCLIHKKYSEDVTASGVFHFTGAPATTWFAFAEYIFEQAATRSSKFAAPKLTPIDTASYPTAAVRPQNSVLGMGKLEQQFSALNNSWQQGVNQALEVLL